MSTAPPAPSALAALVELLDLERIELNLFRGKQPDEKRQRVFGGLVAGQALIAAGRTVEARAVHSLHAYFLRPGDPTIPIVYQVERTRDGRSFSTRRVTAIQHGRAIFTLSASFHIEESTFDHQRAMPDVPGPEALVDWQDAMRQVLAERAPQHAREDRHLVAWVDRERPIESRHVELMDYFGGRQEPQASIWIRARGTLPDDPLLHRCVVAYASDMTLLDTAARPHPIQLLSDESENASLDHAMWFHRPFRADEWLLYAQESPNLSGARGLTTGHFYRRDGTLVASVVQEGLFRIRPRAAQMLGSA
ncbi:MAG: acyl-CoA thioesterase II [Deltaproteobacteria bacterium]|nr:acyl-CoA thioesterase II [Deltaproteobacteria bacterium]